MVVPWLRIVDVVLGVADFASGRSRRIAARVPAGLERAGALGSLEAGLAGVVVAALKEAFDRDSRRLEIERERLEAERLRAERALRLELLRQAGEHEMGRLRLVAGVAAAGWLGALAVSQRVAGGSLGARLTLGAGWLLLVVALVAALAGQSRIGGAIRRIGDANALGDDVSSGAAGAIAPWLIACGLTLVGVAALL